MAYLGNPAETKKIIQKYNLSIQKKFGQNFLIDDSVLENIIDAAGITKEDTVLEIGPGIGTMTQYLAEAAGKVISVEIDRALLPILDDTLSAYDNVEIINNDILKVDIAQLAKEKNENKPLKVVANLPYYITTPIVVKLFESGAPIENITVMVQKEVAKRMAAGPGNSDYGSLSLEVQYYSNADYIITVPPSCFIPQPGVDSAVIRLTRYEDLPVKTVDEKKFFRIIRAAFNQRRKTLVNSISHDALTGFTKEQVQEALRKMEISESIRGEALTLEDFARLTDILCGMNNS